MTDSSLSATIMDLAHRSSDPKDLLKAVRKQHPDASKKDIVRAALHSMIQAAENGDLIAPKLHTLAMDNRSGDDG